MRQRGNKDDFSISGDVEIRDTKDMAPLRCARIWNDLWARSFGDPVSVRPHPSLVDLARLRPDAVGSDRIKILRHQSWSTASTMWLGARVGQLSSSC
jgi:hypothetical protein